MSTVTYKTLLIGVVIIFFIMGGAYAFISPKVDSLEDDVDVPTVVMESGEYEPEDETHDDDSEVPTSSDDTEEEASSEVVTPTTQTPSTPVTPVEVAVPPVVPPTTPAYTLSQIMEHSTKESCWTVIRGKVYDLTPYVSRHPGGERNILKLCGKEGTELFADQHGGDSKPESRLSSLYIGMFTE
jgi:cytochrome b involved in lipid metabolism